MSNISIGDLAQTFQMRRYTTQLKSNLNQLGMELVTGVKSDLSATLSGDFGPIAGIERSLKVLESYKLAISEAATLTGMAQLALEQVETAGRSLTPALLTAESARDVTLIRATAVDARQKMAGVVASLNTQSADRTLFAGSATDGPALADAETMMAALVTATSAETTAAGIAAAVDDWFDTPLGGFETTGYLGSVNPMGPLRLGDGDMAAIQLRADDPVIREVLKGFALSALIAEGALSGDLDEQATLTGIAAERMLTADGDFTDLRAETGALEARIEEAGVRNNAEKSALDLARLDLIAVDPYQAASELEAVYAQIETLYTVTARIARLNFTDYMR